MTFHHRLFPVLLMLALSGCAIQSYREPLPEEPGWENISVADIDQARLKTDTVLGSYRFVLVVDPDLEYNAQWFRTHRRDMTTTDDNRIRKSYTRALKETLEEAFAKSGLTPVASPSSNTLVVSARLTDFRLSAPDLGLAARSRSFVDYAGSARLELVLQDGDTNEPLAEFHDYSRTRSFGGFGQLKETNRMVNLRDFRWMARQWSESIAQFVGGR